MSADPDGIEPLFDAIDGTAPLVVSVPHAGTYLPPSIASCLTPAARALSDTDWYVPRLYEFCGSLGASMIVATHSRYVVDLNRPPDGAPLYPGMRETAVCPTETFDGRPLYSRGAEPAATRIGARIRRYWQPYHERLAAIVHATRARHGRCLLWDAHSIRSAVPALFDGRLPDLNIGTADGRSCHPETARRIDAQLRGQRRFSHVIDGRFKGGYITRHYGRPSAGVEAVQLEIAQSAYLRDETRPAFEPAVAAPLIEQLQALLTALLPARAAGGE